MVHSFIRSIDQINYGFGLIRSAIVSTTNELEEKIEKLENELADKDNSVAILEKRLEEYQLKKKQAELRKRELHKENERLKSLHKRLKIENAKEGEDNKKPIEKVLVKLSTAENLLKVRDTSLLSSKPNEQLSVEGVDAKAFFVAVKEQLSAENFIKFVNNLKLYKEKAITKAEIFKVATDLFGEENKDLLESFQQLMLT